MEVVIVGCKLPNGLVAELNGKQVLFNGANSSALIGGYGTTKVEKDFADAWFAAEKGTAIVDKGIVFAVASEKSANAAAVDGEKSLTGLEGLNEDKPVDGVEKVKE